MSAMSRGLYVVDVSSREDSIRVQHVGCIIVSSRIPVIVSSHEAISVSIVGGAVSKLWVSPKVD